MAFSWSSLGESPFPFAIVEGPDGRLWLPGAASSNPTDILAVTRSGRGVDTYPLTLGSTAGQGNPQITSDGTDLWISLETVGFTGDVNSGIQSYDDTGTNVENYLGNLFSLTTPGPINFVDGFLWTTGLNWTGSGIGIYKFDPGSGVYTRTDVSVPGYTGEFPLKSCVISGLLYYTTGTEQQILKFDPSDLSWEVDVVLDSGDIGVTLCTGPDGNLWVVGNGAQPTVYKIDPATMDVLDTYTILKILATQPGWHVGVIAAQGGAGGVAYDFETTDAYSDGTDVWIAGTWLAEDDSGWSTAALRMHTDGSYTSNTLQALLPKEPSGHPAGTWAWSIPVAILAADDGTIWVSDSGRPPAESLNGAIWGPS